MEIERPKPKAKRERNRMRTEDSFETSTTRSPIRTVDEAIDRVRNLPVVTDVSHMRCIMDGSNANIMQELRYAEDVATEALEDEPIYEEIEERPRTSADLPSQPTAPPLSPPTAPPIVNVETETEASRQSTEGDDIKVAEVSSSSLADEKEYEQLDELEAPSVDEERSVEVTVERRSTVKSTVSSRMYPTLGRQRLSSVEGDTVDSKTSTLRDEFEPIEEPIEHQRKILGDIAQHADTLEVSPQLNYAASASAPPMTQARVHVEPPLLTEEQLRLFYTNHELDILDDFITAFVTVTLSLTCFLQINYISERDSSVPDEPLLRAHFYLLHSVSRV